MTKQFSWLEKADAWLPLFQLLIVPTNNLEPLGTSPFFDFIERGLIKEVMIVIKLGCDLTTQAQHQLSLDTQPTARTTALHVAATAS